MEIRGQMGEHLTSVGLHTQIICTRMYTYKFMCVCVCVRVCGRNVMVFYVLQIHQLSCANQEPVVRTLSRSRPMSIKLQFNDHLDDDDRRKKCCKQ